MELQFETLQLAIVLPRNFNHFNNMKVYNTSRKRLEDYFPFEMALLRGHLSFQGCKIFEQIFHRDLGKSQGTLLKHIPMYQMIQSDLFGIVKWPLKGWKKVTLQLRAKKQMVTLTLNHLVRCQRSFEKLLPSLKLTARPWKWMIGRRSLEFWGWAYFQLQTVSFRKG